MRQIPSRVDIWGLLIKCCAPILWWATTIFHPWVVWILPSLWWHVPSWAQWRGTVKSLHHAPLLLIKTPFSPSLLISLLIFLPIIAHLPFLFFLNFLLIQKIFSLLLIFLHVIVISSSLLTSAGSPPVDGRSSPVFSALWFLPTLLWPGYFAAMQNELCKTTNFVQHFPIC